MNKIILISFHYIIYESKVMKFFFFGELLNIFIENNNCKVALVIELMLGMQNPLLSVKDFYAQYKLFMLYFQCLHKKIFTGETLIKIECNVIVTNYSGDLILTLTFRRTNQKTVDFRNSEENLFQNFQTARRLFYFL